MAEEGVLFCNINRHTIEMIKSLLIGSSGNRSVPGKRLIFKISGLRL
jgi:hypothetical protein